MFTSQNFTAAQTDFALVTISSGQRLKVYRVAVFLSNGASVSVDVKVGFGVAVIDSLITRHPGVAPGSGFVDGSGEPGLAIGSGMATGNDGEDLRLTCGAPTSGSLQVNVTYDVLPQP